VGVATGSVEVTASGSEAGVADSVGVDTVSVGVSADAVTATADVVDGDVSVVSVDDVSSSASNEIRTVV